MDRHSPLVKNFRSSGDVSPFFGVCNSVFDPHQTIELVIKTNPSTATRVSFAP